MTQEQIFKQVIHPKALGSIKFSVYYGCFAHAPQLGSLDVLPKSVIMVDTTGTIVNIIAEPQLSTPEAESEATATALKQLAINYDSSLTEDQIDVIDISCNENKFFFPGFIDTHIHASQFPNNGIFGNSTLLDWLETYTFPLESSFKDLLKAKNIYSKAITRTLTNGTTTASYYATIHTQATNLLADLALELGQRALVGKVCMTQNSPDHYIETFEECQKSTLEVIDHLEMRDPSSELVLPVLTPRFAGSCDDKTLKWLGSLREKKDYHCQTHLSENKAEIKWTNDLYPQYDNYTDIYLKTNLLSHKTILAHCIHLSDEEKSIIQEKHCGISHCPASNSSITSGEARIRWLLNHGINVSLGSDCSGGFTPSILSVAKHALLVSRHLVMKTEDDDEKLSVNDVLHLATMGGAKVLNMEKDLGSFEIGKRFDAQLIQLDCLDSAVDTFDFQCPQWGALDKAVSDNKFQDLIDKWLFNGDDRNVRKVFVNGRCVISK